MLHAVTLLLIVCFAAPLAKMIPLCVLSAILFVVAYNMGEWREIPEILKLSKADVSVWLITFALTVFADLTVAVEAGMILASLLYIGKVTRTTTIALVTPEYLEESRRHSMLTHPIPDGVAIYRIHGPFLFGATDKMQEIADGIDDLPPVVVLRLRNMNAIDATGLHAIEDFADRLKATGRSLILCGMRDQPGRLMQQAQFHEHIGSENFVPSFEAAVERASEILKNR